MKNWRTTLTGLVTSVFYGGLGLLQQGNLNWKDYALMAGATVLGLVAKDAQVTGGSVQQ